MPVAPPPSIAPRPEPAAPRFSVMLPTYEPDGKLARALRSVLDQARSPDAMQIMVVDDDPSVRRFLGSVLTEWGFFVDFCEDGVEALNRLLLDDGYQLLIIDEFLPRMSGEQLIGMCYSFFSRTPLLLLSEDPGAKSTRSLALKTTAVLKKPLAEQELIRCLGTILFGQAPDPRRGLPKSGLFCQRNESRLLKLG